jgi:NAD+ synthase (glutamine-hydrolysing)
MRKQGNLERILASISIAKERGATLRVGPELEIPYVKPCHTSPVLSPRLQWLWLSRPLFGGFASIGESAASLADSFPGDTVLHSWEVLAKILTSEEAQGIVCDIGMYVQIILDALL